MRILTFLAAGLIACALSFGVVYAQNTNLSPVVTSTTLTAGAATQIIGQNPSRKSIQICNVGTTVVMIWPGTPTTFVSAYELPALSTGTTVCWIPPAASAPAAVGNSWGANSFTSTGQVSVFEFP
jgi:hypothetical protein